MRLSPRGLDNVPAWIENQQIFDEGRPPAPTGIPNPCEKDDPMRIHAFQHVAFEDLGTIRLWAEAKGHHLATTRLDADETPAAPDVFDLLVVLGGPMNIYEEEAHPWLAAEKTAIREAVDAGKAVLGICLGAQLVCDVLGGQVTKGEHPEIGWQPVTLTPQGAAHPLFAGFPETFTAFHWHGDTFSIPSGAIHAASSPGCANQAFVLGDRVAGLQFHLETAPVNLVSLIKHCGSEIVPGDFVQTPKAMHNGRASFAPLRDLMSRFLDSMEAVIGS